MAVMSFPEALERYNTLCAAADAASVALNAIPGIGSGQMGLTPDAVKASPVYRVARADYEAANARAKAFAVPFIKVYGRELAAHRAAEREAKRAAREAGQ